MGIRSTVASLIGGDQIESRVRDVVEGILAAKGFARPADLQELREQVQALRAGGPAAADGGLADRVAALEADNASLRKRVDMLRGAVDAATAQLADVRRAVDGARSEAQKALNVAEAARVTAEALAESDEPAPAPAPAADGRLDLNQATAEQLELLPGIGPSMAFRIVEDREANGRFHKVGDLSRVKGLGASTIKKLDALLRV